MSVEIVRVARPMFPWLPARARPVGLALAASGALLAYAVLARGFRPKVLDVSMFAVHARYFEARAFTVIEKNASLELAIVLLISGLFAAVFSRDAVETPESERLRVRSLVWAVCIGTILMLVATLTLFGLSFAYALSAHAALTLALAFALASASRIRGSRAASRAASPRAGGAS